MPPYSYSSRWLCTQGLHCKSVVRGVPQGSVLGPLLFNIYINDLLLFIQDSDLCNYADDTTIYTCNKSIENIVHKLENDGTIALKWFADIFMKLNADKYHLLVLGQRCGDPVTVRIGSANVVNSYEEKLLGVQIDSRLSFETMFPNCARRLPINFMHLPAYHHIWIREN